MLLGDFLRAPSIICTGAFWFENRLCQPRNALKLTLPQEYESLVESSQQYQHLDNPVYRVCIERAANAGVKDDLEIYPRLLHVALDLAPCRGNFLLDVSPLF